MNRFTLLFLAALLALATTAQADFPLKPSVEGRHPLRVEITRDPPLASLCIDRVDVDPPVELFCCVPGGDCVEDPAFPDGSVMELLVPLAVTPGVVVEIRGRVISEMNVPSTYSLDAAIADFRVPSAPILRVSPEPQ